MASGADVLARFLPNSGNARDYLPNQALQQQILDNITSEQQRRIKEMGDVQASAASAPFQGLASAEQGFLKGHDLAQSEEEHAAKMKQSQANTAATEAGTQGRQTQNQRDQLAYQTEEQHQKFLDSDDPKNPGHSRRENLEGSEYEWELGAPGRGAQKAAQEQAESDARINSAKAGTAQIYGGLKNEAQDREASAFGKIIDGIATQYPPGPQRDAAIQSEVAKAQQHSPSGINPDFFNAFASSTTAAHDAAINTGKAAKEAGTQTLPGYGELQAATGKAANTAKAIQNLQAQAAAYKSNPRFSAKASAAKDGFVATLHQLGHAGDQQAETLAQQLESHSPFDGTNSSIMDNALSVLTQSARDSWDADKARLPQGVRDRPEYTGTENLMSSLGAGGAPPTTNIAGGPPGGNNADFLAGPRAKKPPGTATAAPGQAAVGNALGPIQIPGLPGAQPPVGGQPVPMPAQPPVFDQDLRKPLP